MNPHLKALIEQRDQLREERDEASQKLSGLASQPPSENRSEAIGRLNRKLDKLDNQLAHAERDVREEQAAEDRERRDSIAAGRREVPVIPDDGGYTGHGGGGAIAIKRGLPIFDGPRVVREEQTYRRGGQHGFFKDLAMASLRNDMGAAQRLERHRTEARHELRDITTGDPGAAGFVPPIYLAQEWIELPRPKRPLADAVPDVPLSETGMRMDFPRVATGTSVASQSPENTAISETDSDTETYSVDVRTIAGVQDISIQTLERTAPGYDEVLFRDLTRAYDAELDRQLTAGSGATGQHRGLRNVVGIIDVPWAPGTASGKGFMSQVYEAASLLATQAFTEATHVVLHPRRAAWLANSVLTGETYILAQSGTQVGQPGTQDRAAARDIAGLVPVVDPNIAVNLGASTNQDEAYVVAMDELMLAEGVLNAEVFRTLGGATETLTARVRLYSYSAFAGGRVPKAVARINGTGMATPSFPD
jgi:HK97 family phage major capsid protein